VEEKLFSSGKDKILAAIHALQHCVLEFHGIPFQPQLHNNDTAGSLNFRSAHTGGLHGG
jgi:hypothetical protein